MADFEEVSLWDGYEACIPRTWADGTPMALEVYIGARDRIDKEARSYPQAFAIIEEEIAKFQRDFPDQAGPTVIDKKRVRYVESRGGRVHHFWFRGERSRPKFRGLRSLSDLAYQLTAPFRRR